MSTEAANSERGPLQSTRHATRARVSALVGLAVLLVSACSLNQPPPVGGPAPPAPPAPVCGNSALLTGPSTPPAGAVVLPAGDNSAQIGEKWLIQPNTTYWFAPGIHTLGNGEYDQIVPNTNTTWIGAPGAVLDGRRINRFAFTQDATGVTIKYLEIRNFVSPRDQGVVNHDFGANWTISNNWIHHNDGAGLFIGTNNVARHNCLERNGQYGFQGAGSNLLIDRNEISNNNTGDWEAHVPGCGCTGGGKFWDVNGATITNNYVHDNLSVGLWADTNDRAFEFSGNYISGNSGPGIFYEISYNAKITNNTFVRNGLVDGPTNPGFPTGAIYLSESWWRHAYRRREIFDARHFGNVFTDNWSGVILWENADRFCNSPGNTSTGYCTLGGTATLSKSCSARHQLGTAV